MAFALMSYSPIAMAVDDKPPVDVQELFTSTKPFAETLSHTLKLKVK
tara:strand:- start:123 stop:263 length:141 start_codon:yes stop_codon:yes gene_type:complete